MDIKELRSILGENLRKRRLECGLSQQALGNSVGLSHAQINRIEKGISSTPIDLLAKAANALDAAPVHFLIPTTRAE